MINLRHHSFTYIFAAVTVAALLLVPLFSTASCRSLQQTPAEVKARETLRAMTRNGLPPSEEPVARIESAFPRTTAAALARIIRARIKLDAQDFAGAAAMLDSSIIRDRTLIGDYALYLRASALDRGGRQVDARAAYDKVAHDYPDSLRARDAVLRSAQMLIDDLQAGRALEVLRDLTAKDDAAALLLRAKAYEQKNDTTQALAAYRRAYFYAPASKESFEAGLAIKRLNSTTVPATAEEANTRAEKLFAAKRFTEAFDAYGEAATQFPGGLNS